MILQNFPSLSLVYLHGCTTHTPGKIVARDMFYSNRIPNFPIPNPKTIPYPNLNPKLTNPVAILNPNHIFFVTNKARIECHISNSRIMHHIHIYIISLFHYLQIRQSCQKPTLIVVVMMMISLIRRTVATLSNASIPALISPGKNTSPSHSSAK